MKIFSVTADQWRMDGGACFGVVPKTVWGKHVPSDENNKIPISTRCLLVDTGDRLILFDTGMGNKQSEKFFSYYYLFGEEGLEKSFKALGYTFEQVTDVVFTHLHFDHVGGALRWGPDGKTPEPVFPNATHYCSKEHWDWAMDPNPREKASFFPENYLPLFESGRLEFIHEEGEFCPGVHLTIKNGHTRGQIIPVVDYKGRKVVFTADFIAAVLNIPLAYVPSFDIEPLISMQEKESFYKEALAQDYVLFFQHDFDHECCTLEMTPKGVRAKEIFKLSDLNGQSELSG
jgi:glyoxylase-like metal-dependent hydrolase (beta-lactamase superfamily II)